VCLSGMSKQLVTTISSGYSLIGEVAHIVAEAQNGPRGASKLTLEERNSAENAILMCTEHHKTIDDHPEQFTVTWLLELKRTHEENFRLSTEFDQALLFDRAKYAEYIDQWIALGHVDEWSVWTSWLPSGDWPRLNIEVSNDLETLTDWLFNRIWPSRYPDVETSLMNFRAVLSDLLSVFLAHAEKQGDQWQTVKFYKEEGEWLPQQEYARRVHRYEFHCDLVTDLTLELTRAANYVCDTVRFHLDPEFRFKEGVLTVQMGPFGDFRYRTYRPEYRASERTASPYPGLKEFRKIRHTRDVNFGKGTSAADPNAIKDLIERSNTLPDLE
jgi:HNH endonuclease